MLLACRGDGRENGRADEESAVAEREGSFQLDLTNRSVTKPVGSGLGDSTSAKFVEIDISEVLNPKKIRLAFEVHYQGGNGEKVLLGNFALFPPDRPGKFIVATGGHLRSEGAVVLSMLVLDEVGPADRVAVKVRHLSLRKE